MTSRLRSSYRAVLTAFATLALAVGMSFALAAPAHATEEVPCDSTLSFALSTPFNNFGTTCFSSGGPPNSTVGVSLAANGFNAGPNSGNLFLIDGSSIPFSNGDIINFPELIDVTGVQVFLQVR